MFAWAVVGGGVDQEVDRLIALEIDNAERLAGLDAVPPRRARGHHLVMDDRAGKTGEVRIGGAHRR